MIRFIISLVVIFILIVCFPQNNSPVPDYLSEYKKAEKIFTEAENYEAWTGDLNTEEKMNRQALDIFLNIIPVTEKQKDDSLAFHCYYKAGILNHYFENTTEAIKFYLKALSTQSPAHPVPDSFYFKPHLFAGSIYYGLENFDSALYHYKKADEILGRYSNPLSESERLYNRLGAIYYETGNYSMAKNYFEKAVAILGPPDAVNEELYVYYKNNIATSLLKLERYDAANTIYKSILSFKKKENEILNNIGFIQLELGAAEQALGYFRKIKDTSGRMIQVLNHTGRAYLQLNKPDSAGYYFQLSLSENNKRNGNRKNILRGLAYRYSADLLLRKNRFEDALNNYQQAIMQVAFDFSNSDIITNPENFSGVFSYINLFSILSSKAAAFEKWYAAGNESRHLEAALNSWRSAFSLAAYVEKTYNSDEARVFLNKIKYTEHDAPIQVCLKLYEITGEKKYIEEAWYFDQLNKASILSLNIAEAESRFAEGEPAERYKNAEQLKNIITRLTLKTALVNDSVQLSEIKSAIRDNEIELDKLESQNTNPAITKVPSISQVQKIVDETTTLISYHLSETELVSIVISKNNFWATQAAIAPDFFTKIDSLRSLLSSQTGAGRSQVNLFAAELYNFLFAPIVSKFSASKRLIIIPDDELNYLPFDMLTDGDKKYVLEKFSTQYLYSASLLLLKKNQTVYRPGTMAFAPFVSKSYTDEENTFTILPGSLNETANLDGELFSDSQATRSQFLQSLNTRSIIHLATHAQVNNTDPDRSFITFYPDKKDSAGFKIFAREISNLRMDSTRLVILSACETGSGKLLKGEGLMSLSRAFAYAGCPNVITSLWKANDQTTAIISSRLHYYLSRGFAPDMALQKAKTDLLRNSTIDPRLKQPNYWAHLISVGNYEPIKHGLQWRWVAIFTIALMLIYYFTKKQVKKLPDSRLN